MGEKFKLMEHQELALEMLKANTYLMTAFDLGTGKTMIALAYIHYCLKRGIVKDALIACPASLVASWEQAIEDIVKFEGFDASSVKLLKDNITIRSFQKLYKTTKIPVGHRDGQVTYKRRIDLRDDVDKHWGIFVVDEIHQCSSHSAVQTKAAIALAQLSSRRVGLTATPTHGGKGKADYSKLYGEIQVLTAGRQWKNWTEFCNKAVTVWDRWHKPVAYDEVYCRKVMEDNAIVCRIEDCVDMPSKVEQSIKCPLSEKKIYKDIKEGNFEPYGIDIEVAGGQYLKLLQIVSGSMKVDETRTMQLKSSKDDVLCDLLNGTEDSVVVFCNFRASIDRVATLAKKCGRKVTKYDGRAKKDDWKDFAEGRTDCIVAQYQSGSAGLNLQNSHTMIFYEPTLSALLLSQAKGRIYRKGQDKKCIYYYLETPGSIEPKVFDLVRSGVDINEQMLADMAQGTWSD